MSRYRRNKKERREKVIIAIMITQLIIAIITLLYTLYVKGEETPLPILIILRS